MGEAEQDLKGKVVASTSFVTPDQGEAFATLVSAAGGQYLDLEIAAYPSQVRSGNGVFLVSGPRAAYEAHRAWFERIGRATYVNDAPAAAYISGMAVQVAFFPMAVGLLQGLRIAESQGLSPDWFKKAVLEFYPFHIDRLLDRVTAKADSSAPDVEASVDVMAAGAAGYAGVLRQHGPRLRDVRRPTPAIHRRLRSRARGGRLDVHRRARRDALGGAVPAGPSSRLSLPPQSTSPRPANPGGPHCSDCGHPLAAATRA